MPASFVQTDVAEGIATITLNRPEKYNALTSEALDDLGEAVEAAAASADVQALVLAGAGKAFCAGLDVAEIERMIALTLPGRRALLRRWGRAIGAFEVAEKPVVAALHGHVLGAGLEIALACDVRVAATDARLALVETRLGGIPDGGGCTRLARVVGLGRAKEMIMTGNAVGAEEAHRIGLVNRLVEPGDLARAARDFARELLQGGPLGVAMAKRLITLTFNLDVDAGLAVETLVGSHLYSTEDTQAAYRAFLAKQRPTFQGR
jgi:enoyl-CoA hydratase/carnithine racemase